MNTLSLSVLFGIVFGFLGALMAFLIAYEGYQHHFIERKKALGHSLQTALFAFILFLIIGFLAGIIFGRV